MKAALKQRGVSLKKLLNPHGFHVSAGEVVLTRPWPGVEFLIAGAPGVPPFAIWPSRYRDTELPDFHPLFSSSRVLPPMTDYPPMPKPR